MGGIRIAWGHSDAAVLAQASLERYGRATIELPGSYHHALCARLRGGGQAEVLDVRGGIELLEHMAEIPGLEALGSLAAVARGCGATVRLTSPCPTIDLAAKGIAPRPTIH